MLLLTAFLRNLVRRFLVQVGRSVLVEPPRRLQIPGNLNATECRGHYKTSLLWSLGINKEDEVGEAQAWS